MGLVLPGSVLETLLFRSVFLLLFPVDKKKKKKREVPLLRLKNKNENLNCTIPFPFFTKQKE